MSANLIFVSLMVWKVSPSITSPTVVIMFTLIEEDPSTITAEDANRISKIKDMENFFKAGQCKILLLNSYDLWMLSNRERNSCVAMFLLPLGISSCQEC